MVNHAKLLLSQKRPYLSYSPPSENGDTGGWMITYWQITPRRIGLCTDGLSVEDADGLEDALPEASILLGINKFEIEYRESREEN